MMSPISPILSLERYLQVRSEYFGEGPDEAWLNYTYKYKPAKEKIVGKYSLYMRETCGKDY